MALTKDEAGRERSAPTQRKLPPAPRQEKRTAPPPPSRSSRSSDDGPRAERRREQPVTLEKLLNPGNDLSEFFASRIATAPRAQEPRRAERPPALAPRSKDAVMRYNQAQTDAEIRGAQSSRVADMYQSMALRQQKAEKREQREKNDREETAKALTAKEWSRLTPLQQASVQANADLAAAIERDLKDQGKHHANDEQMRRYLADSESLFGKDTGVGFKGVEYAPNTVAFLNERGLKGDDLKGKTLDDFISGDLLTTSETLSQLDKTLEGEALFKVRPDDVAFADRLARGQMQYQEDLAAKLKRGDQLLSGLSGRATSDAAGQSFGAAAPEPLRLPDVKPETMAQIDMYMEALARSDSPVDQALGAINLDLQQRGATPKEAEQVFGELMQRSRQAMTGEGKWFEGIDFPMRSPVEVAQALGAPTLKRRATTGG